MNIITLIVEKWTHLCTKFGGNAVGEGEERLPQGKIVI